ncbi:hypothetical protein T4D_15565 [Trichinella pseudospiralis]|uniref:Uncharacterized protein n=1 Tax=Trichinella pseudospiralis TaxID=6337 RepID=A0A0V1F2P7_TRIPS|nr:hypothetical protein T4D_15565 [Trichinella pseudospiralis]
MPVFLLYKCKTPEPGILSLFRIIHRLRVIENLDHFKWNNIDFGYVTKKRIKAPLKDSY